RLSSLSRGQINQLISRYGVGVHGRAIQGGARNFTPADAFAFCVAGRASALGVDMPTIRDIIACLPIPALDPSTFEQREIFPGYSRSCKVFFVVTERDGEFRGEFVADKQVHLVTRGAAAALVFPA